MSSEDYVEVPPDSTGKKLRALKKNVGGNDVFDEVVAVEDGSGNVIDPRKNVEVTGLVVVGASALPTGAATESTLGSVKAKTDNLDTPLSGVKSKTDNIPADPAREGGNLASIKSKTDNIDVALSTRALETGGNLATLAGKDFATQTTLALIKAKTDNVDAALSTRALEAGGNLATIAGKDFATQTTLALIKAKTDNLDTALSGIKSKTDNLDVALSTRALESGGNLAALAGKDFATQTTLALVKTKTDNLDVALSTRLKIANYVLTQELGKVGIILTTGGSIVDPRSIRALTSSDIVTVVQSTPANLTATVTQAAKDRTVTGTLTQSTKHDAKTYIYAFGDIATTGLLGLAKAANKVIKIHYYSLQSVSDGQTVYFYEETTTTQLSKKWILNAREGQESPFVTAPANLPKCATPNKDIGLNLLAATHVYWELIYSVDDAS